MKLSRSALPAVCALMVLGSTAMNVAAQPAEDDQTGSIPRRSRVVACDKAHRCVDKQGNYLEVVVRNRRQRNDDYDYNRGYTFEVAGFERPTLRYGNTGFIGQNGFFGNSGFRTQLGSASFDNLR